MTIVIDKKRLKQVEARHLGKGGHESFEDGMCVMEAVAYVAGKPWSDSPPCVSPTIGAFLRNWNDSLPDDETRDRLLKPLIPKVIGTASTRESDQRRGWMAIDWMVREFTPEWLDLAGLKTEAAALRQCAELKDIASCESCIMRALIPAKKKAAAARDATRAAAWDAARDAAGAAARAAAGAAAWAAARDAAGDAAWAAAWDAAWAAAGDAAWAAARAAAGAAAGAAAWDAAGDAARAAAWDAARDAAWDAARDAAGAAARAAAWDAAAAAAGAAARAAAWDAARKKLAPTVSKLQKSALKLVERMIAAQPPPRWPG